MVDVDSCPSNSQDFMGQKPTWDYCVDGPHEATWNPEPVDSPGLTFHTKLAGGPALFSLTICAALLTRRCARLSSRISQRQRSQELPEIHEVGDPAKEGIRQRCGEE